MANVMTRFGATIGATLYLTAAPASAITLNDVTIGSSIFSADDLDVIADNAFFEAVDPFGDIFVSAPLDGGAVDDVLASDTDLSIFNLTFTEILGGTALDIELDAQADTISILYDLAINEESSDPFGVAVLFFGIDLTDGILNVAGDLDGELVDLDIFGATRAITVAPIPLPAGAWLLVSGILGLGALSRRRRA